MYRMGQLEQMLAYHKAHDKLQQMSNDRAMEMEARKPNVRRRQILLNTIPAEIEGLRGGGKPGLQRIVGGARKMKKAESMADAYFKALKGSGELKIEHASDSDSEEECEPEEKEMEMEDKKGGFLPMLAAAAIPLLSNLFGSGKHLKKGGYAMGREMGQHIKELHGEGFLSDLVSGIGSVVGKMLGAGSPAGMAAADSAQVVYKRGTAVRRVAPGAIEGKAEQGPDYAPKWFRESGDIAGGGRGTVETAMMMPHKGKGRAGGAMAGGAMKAKRALSDRQKARNAMVKKLMSEKGMKLGEASRYIKEHGLI